MKHVSIINAEPTDRVPLNRGMWRFGSALLAASIAVVPFAAFAKGEDPAGAPVYDIPTGLPPSPLFGATPFSQKLLPFEEFGQHELPAADCPSCVRLPTAADCQSSPTGAALDTFLAQPLSPLPQEAANQSERNPWEKTIGQCIGRVLNTSAIEGRAPGVWFSHQRWNEFRPQEYVQTAMASARMNGGLRDTYQRHGYAVGEFGPGGLYHHGGTMRGVEVRIHPNMPVQQGNSVWTFDGTLPPKL
ncbi:MAG: hypothetical protein ACKOBM_11735, partial [Gammaproteobacteria bacterium]